VLKWATWYSCLCLYSRTFPLSANADTVVGVSTVAGVPALAGLPFAVDICDVSINSVAANPTVANILHSCQFLLLLLASLLNVAGFYTAAAVNSDVNGDHLSSYMLLPASLLLLASLLFLASILCWRSRYCIHSCCCLRSCCWAVMLLLSLVAGVTGAACITGVACILFFFFWCPSRHSFYLFFQIFWLKY
jgi:hypothetical protein